MLLQQPLLSWRTVFTTLLPQPSILRSLPKMLLGRPFGRMLLHFCGMTHYQRAQNWGCSLQLLSRQHGWKKGIKRSSSDPLLRLNLSMNGELSHFRIMQLHSSQNQKQYSNPVSIRHRCMTYYNLSGRKDVCSSSVQDSLHKGWHYNKGYWIARIVSWLNPIRDWGYADSEQVY